MRSWCASALVLGAGVACARASFAQADGGVTAASAKASEAAVPELPESPAFDALGTTPSDVLRPSAIRALGVDLAGAVDASGTVKPGFSLEAAPIWLAAGGETTLQQWRDSYAQRLASWVSLSLASLAADDAGTSTAEGLRVVLYDDSDPRFDKDLTTCLDHALKGSFGSAPGAPPPHATPSSAEKARMLSSLNDVLTACRKQSLERMSQRVTFSAAVAGALTQHIKKGDALPDDWARKRDAWITAAVNGVKLTDGVALSTTATLKYESDGSTGGQSVSSALRARAGDLAKAVSADLSWKPRDEGKGWHDRIFTLSGRISWPIFEKLWVEGTLGAYFGPDSQGQKAFGSLRLKFNAGSE